MFTRRFWVAAAERAVKSFAQGVVLYFGGDVVLNAWTADWPTAGGIGLGAAALSVLTSMGSTKVSDSASPSLVKE